MERGSFFYDCGTLFGRSWSVEQLRSIAFFTLLLSIWWKIALIELFTCLHVMFCLLRSSLSYHRELVKPHFGPIFPCSSTSRLISDFRLPRYLTFSLWLVVYPQKFVIRLVCSVLKIYVFYISVVMLNAKLCSILCFHSLWSDYLSECYIWPIFIVVLIC